MSIIGDSLTIGNPLEITPFPVYGVLGTINSSALQNLTNHQNYYVDTDFFSISGTTLTCKKAGKYRLNIRIRSCFNTGGGNIAGTAYWYKGNSSILSKASGTSDRGWYTAEIDTTLALNDQLIFKGKNNSDSINMTPADGGIYYLGE